MEIAPERDHRKRRDRAHFKANFNGNNRPCVWINENLPFSGNLPKIDNFATKTSRNDSEMTPNDSLRNQLKKAKKFQFCDFLDENCFKVLFLKFSQQ